jgi:hypothetical protein
VADLVFEIGDNLSGLLLIVLGLLNEFPGLLYFLAEDGNGLRVLLGQLDGRLDSRGILQNGLVQVLAPVYNSYIKNLFKLKWDE